MGPLHGCEGHRARRASGPGPFAGMLLSDMGAEVVRVDRAEVAGRRTGTDAVTSAAAGARSAVDLKHPDGVECVLEMVEPADALIDPFRPGVTERLGIGPDVVPRAQPAPRVRAHDRLGPGRPARARAGHDINYISLAGALAHFARAGRPADAAAQPDRRLRRRRHVPRVRHRVRGPRSARVGEGPGRRRGDGRRRRGADVGRSGASPRGLWQEEPGVNLLDTGARLLRHVRDHGRQVDQSSARSRPVLRRVPRPGRASTRRRPPEPDGARGVARAAQALHRALPDQDTRRVVRDPRRHRRVLRAGAADERGEARIRTSWRERRSSTRRHRASPRPRRASRARPARSRVRRRWPARTPTRRSPTGASADEIAHCASRARRGRHRRTLSRIGSPRELLASMLAALVVEPAHVVVEVASSYASVGAASIVGSPRRR